MSTVAGRVAIVPKDAWKSTSNYLRLDLVTYEGHIYVAKKAVSAGTLPTDTEYWMDCGDLGSVAQKELESIVSSAEYSLLLTTDKDPSGTITGAPVYDSGIKIDVFNQQLKGVTLANFAICNTASSETNKKVMIDNYKMVPGGTIKVQFVNENTAILPTLTVNDGSAIPICKYGTEKLGGTPDTSWHNGEILELCYDGTCWLMINYSSSGLATTEVAEW